MSTAKINIKNIDYFKYRKLVIDGNRDDYALCSREVKSLCDAVQTLTFRDDEFDDCSDRARFDEVSTCYRQILASKRIDPLDMRLKSGWWGEAGRAGSGYSAGIKLSALYTNTCFTSNCSNLLRRDLQQPSVITNSNRKTGCRKRQAPCQRQPQ